MDKIIKVFRGNSRGISLIEVIIALAILGVVAGAFLGGVGTAYKADIIADERSTAQSLASSEMEYVKSCDYDRTHNPPQYSIDPSLTIPDGYTIQVAAERLDPKGDGTGNDDGTQKIAVTIKHHGKEIITLEDYKVDR